MGYIAFSFVVITLPLFLGYLWGRRRFLGKGFHPLPALGVALVSGTAWFALAWGARRYADTDLPGWAVAELWAHTGKWCCFAVCVLLFLGVAAGMEKPRPSTARILICCAAVLLTVWLAVWRTMPVYPFLPQTSHRDSLGIMRQTSDFTCGPVSLANLAEQYFGMTNLTERQVARWAGTTVEGTTMGGLIRAARHLGLEVSSCRIMTMEELEREAAPALVFLSTIPAVRHATLFCSFSGDRVILIDPDRSYGRMEMPRHRFEQVWYGKALILRNP